MDAETLAAELVAALAAFKSAPAGAESTTALLRVADVVGRQVAAAELRGSAQMYAPPLTLN